MIITLVVCMLYDIIRKMRGNVYIKLVGSLEYDVARGWVLSKSPNLQLYDFCLYKLRVEEPEWATMQAKAIDPKHPKLIGIC